MTVAAGQVAIATDSTTEMVVSGSAADAQAWLDGRLVFKSVPTRDVLASLSRWYGYEFHLADPHLATQHLTAVFSTNSAEDAFSALKLLLDVDLKFDGHVVTLVPRKATRHVPTSRNVLPPGPAPTPREVGR
jgi:ferric-dicitrate binding protein FerR (iron transport regulator)